MMWLKSCPRCRGNLFADADFYARYVVCIRCGETPQQWQQSIVQKSVFGRRSATPPEPSREAQTLVA